MATRILLVEDSPEDAELVLQGLDACRLAGDVLHVRDGAEALDYVFRRGPFLDRPGEQPAVILLDLKMPRVDGTEVLRQLKGDPALKVIPVVVMTSSTEDADLLRTYSLGVNAYIVKPVGFHDFVGAVRQLGTFWAALNQAPPGSTRGNRPPG